MSSRVCVNPKGTFLEKEYCSQCGTIYTHNIHWCYKCEKHTRPKGEN